MKPMIVGCLIAAFVFLSALSLKGQSKWAVAPYFGVGKTIIEEVSQYDLPYQGSASPGRIGYFRRSSLSYGIEVKYAFYKDFSFISGMGMLEQRYFSYPGGGHVISMFVSSSGSAQYSSNSLALPLLLEKSFAMNDRNTLRLNVSAGFQFRYREAFNKLSENLSQRNTGVDRAEHSYPYSPNDSAFDYLIVKYQTDGGLATVPMVSLSISYEVYNKVSLALGFRHLAGYDKTMSADMLLFDSINDQEIERLWNDDSNNEVAELLLIQNHEPAHRIQLSSEGRMYYGFVQIQLAL